jgi:hypothetical protein
MKCTRYYFTVPDAISPTLQGAISDSTFTLTVQGIDNVIYEIESSSDATNWVFTSSQTNAPFQYDDAVVPNTQRSYQVKILGR